LETSPLGGTVLQMDWSTDDHEKHIILGRLTVYNERVYGQNCDKSKWRHRNDDRQGYSHNGDKPKQHLQF